MKYSYPEMRLTDTAIRNTKAAAKPLKLSDGHGLYLLVTPSGGKWWRFKYFFAGKEKLLSLGVYPDIGLKDARKLVAAGVDPSQNRKAIKAGKTEGAANSFEVVTREWFAKFEPGWAKSHSDKIIRRLELDIFPWIGARPIAEITAPELLAVLRRIESRGAIDTTHRAHQNCGQVFRYAIATGRAERDPSADLRGAIPPAQRKHYATITDPARIGDLLRAIDDYNGSLITRCALQLAPLVFVRPGELRWAEWKEFDLDAAEWRIPAERMKARVRHTVPLSTQAIYILRELYPLTRSSRYVFPGRRSMLTPMSENTVNAALRNLGYVREEITGHGFRGMASTLLNEQGWHRDAIERQLAHGERDKVRAAYNHAEHIPERRKMMQAWADFLDTLRDSSVVPIRKWI